MKYILIILLLTSTIQAQPIEKIAVTSGATIGYALLDVVLYPIAERSGTVNEYRMLQGAVITGITYVLVKKYDYKTGASFLINVYCGIPDLIYYQFRPSEFRNDNLGHLKFLITAGKKVIKSHLYQSAFIGLGLNFTLNF